MVVEEVSNKFCKRCHRELKDNKSKELGYGPICYKKYLQKQKVYLFEMEENKRSRNMNIEEVLAKLWLKVATSSSFETKDYPNCIVMKRDLETLLTAYDKEKEKNNRYFNQNIEYQKTLENLQKKTIWKDDVREVIQNLDKRIVEKSEINYFANLTVGESLSFKHFLEKEILKEE